MRAMTCDDFRAAYPRLGVPGPAARHDTDEYRAWSAHFKSCRACADFAQAAEVRRKGVDVDRYPCVHVAYHSLPWCDEHVEARECPEVAIIYTPEHEEFGIHLYDGTTLAIGYCPWCGVKLPRSKRS